MRRESGTDQRKCVICGKPFRCSPSDNYVTCSKECQSVRAGRALRTRVEQGDHIYSWTPERRTTARENPAVAAQRKAAQVLGTQAAQKSPVAGRFETNQNAKVWTLVSPEGKIYQVRNLLLWAREHTDLFDKPPGDRSAQQIRAGFAAIAQTMRGGRGPEKRQRGSMSYLGWTLKELPKGE